MKERGKDGCPLSCKIPRKVSGVPPPPEGRAAWSGEQQLCGQAQLAGRLALLGRVLGFLRVPTHSGFESFEHPLYCVSGHAILASTSEESDEGGAAQPPRKKLRSSNCQAQPSVNMQTQQTSTVSYSTKMTFCTFAKHLNPRLCCLSRPKTVVLPRIPTMVMLTTMAPSRSLSMF